MRVAGPFRASDWNGKDRMKWGFICTMTTGVIMHYSLHYSIETGGFTATRSEPTYLKKLAKAMSGSGRSISISAQARPWKGDPDLALRNHALGRGFDEPYRDTLKRLLTDEDRAAMVAARLRAGRHG